MWRFVLAAEGNMDRDDWLVVIGIALIGLALYMQFGTPIALAYAGVIMVVLGIFLSRPKVQQ